MDPAQPQRSIKALLVEPGNKPRPVQLGRRTPSPGGPMISCMMPTRGLLFPARHAIECFDRQSYPNRELVVVCKSPNSEVKAYVAELRDPRIRYFETLGASTVGDLRNAALARCEGDFVCIWDDDDLYHPRRLAVQMAAVESFEAQASFLQREMLWWPEAKQLAVSRARVWENSMLAARAALGSYPSLQQGEDTAVTESLVRSNRVVVVDTPAHYVRIYHGANVCDAGHFAAHFEHATVSLTGDEYDRMVRHLARSMPVGAYQRTLAAAPV